MSASEAFVRAAGLLMFVLLLATLGSLYDIFIYPVYSRYRRLGKTVEYLLLQASYHPFHWTPPKGHVDPGEEEWTAAIREVREETGIAASELDVDKEFHYDQHYKTHEAPKRVRYWLAAANSPQSIEVKLSSEHTNFKWLMLEKALELVGYEEMKEMLKAADKYLSNKE